jgi:hypothetical protein
MKAFTILAGVINLKEEFSYVHPAKFNVTYTFMQSPCLKEPYLTQLIERVKQTLFHGKGESD